MFFRTILIILFIIALPFQASAKNIEDKSNNFKVEIPDHYLIAPKEPGDPFLFIGIDNEVKGRESMVFIYRGEILKSHLPGETFNTFDSEKLKDLVDARIRQLENNSMIIKSVTASQINNRMYILSTYKNAKNNMFCLEGDLLLNKRFYTISFIAESEEIYNIKEPEYIKILKSFDELY